MWKLAMIIIGTCVLLLTSSVSGQCFTNKDDDGQRVATDALDRLVAGSTEFALNLFVNVNKAKMGPKDNVVLSPISVWSGLTATWHGAQGHTKQQLEEVLKYGDHNQKRVSQLYHDLTTNLQNDPSKEANYTLKLVNKIYIDQYISVRDCILDHLGSEVEKMNLSSNPEESRIFINQWVEEQTNNKIVKLLPDDYIDFTTVMVLVNAIYFKGYWKHLFKEKLTKTADFFVEPDRPIEVDMMHLPGQMLGTANSADLGCSAIELQFRSSDVRMVILLPDEGTKVEDLVSKLGAANLKELLGSLMTFPVDLRIPKFKAEESLELKDHLRALGIEDLFLLEMANLTGFSDTDTYVKFVRHKARIDVTESGVEAAAATAVSVSVRAPPMPFHVNRPFVFLIHDQKTDAILFLGTIKNPERTAS